MMGVRNALSRVILGGLIILAPLAGCTPEPSGQVAIRKAGDSFEFVFATCPGQRMDTLSVFDRDADPLLGWRIEASDTSEPVSVVRLLEAPAGWDVVEDTLTGFESGRSYSISASAHLGPQSLVSNFTLDQLNELKDDQVLARANDGARAVSMDEFESAARSDC